MNIKSDRVYNLIAAVAIGAAVMWVLSPYIILAHFLWKMW